MCLENVPNQWEENTVHVSLLELRDQHPIYSEYNGLKQASIGNTSSEQTLCSDLLPADIHTHIHPPTYTYTNSYIPTSIIKQDDHTLKINSRDDIQIQREDDQDSGYSEQSIISQSCLWVLGRQLKGVVGDFIQKTTGNNNTNHNFKGISELQQLREKLHEQQVQNAMHKIQLDEHKQNFKSQIENWNRDRETLVTKLCQAEANAILLQEAKTVAENKNAVLTAKLQKCNQYADSLNDRLANLFTELDTERQQCRVSHGIQGYSNLEPDEITNSKQMSKENVTVKTNRGGGVDKYTTQLREHIGQCQYTLEYPLMEVQVSGDENVPLFTPAEGLTQVSQLGPFQNILINTKLPRISNILSSKPDMTQHQQPYAYSSIRSPTQFATNTPLLSHAPTSQLSYATQKSNPSIDSLVQIIKDILQYSIDRDKSQKENEDLNNVIKLRNGVKTVLTTKGMRQGDFKGLQFLTQYIHEVEQTCPYSPMRVAMLPYTVEPSLLKRLKLDMGILNRLTWTDVKKKLMSYLPKVEPWEAEKQLLSMKMTAEDDVEEFASRMMNKYSEMCQLLNVEELDTPLNDMLAYTMTYNMHEEVKRPYEESIKRDPDCTIQWLEKSFQNKAYRASVFYPITLQAKSTDFKSSHGSNQTIFNISRQNSFKSDNETNVSEVNQRKRPSLKNKKWQILKSWKDWTCTQCGDTNRSTWFTCDREGCDGRATESQTPKASWNCLLECGQTNLRFDHYCYSCLRPNQNVKPDHLRELPPYLTKQPRERQAWPGRRTVLEPVHSHLL